MSASGRGIGTGICGAEKVSGGFTYLDVEVVLVLETMLLIGMTEHRRMLANGSCLDVRLG